MNYDFIAPVFDYLARFIFGKSLTQAQTYFFDHIKNDQKVLIIGGGAGQLLSHFRQSDVSIDFVEPSRAMIKKAQGRILQKGVEVNFHVYDILQHQSKDKYDVIICPFVLDVFEKDQLDQALLFIKSSMHQSSILFVTDFEISDNLLWKSLLSKSMHLFFRLTTGLKNKALLPIDQIVVGHGFNCVDAKWFFKSFIFSKKYVIV